MSFISNRTHNSRFPLVSQEIARCEGMLNNPNFVNKAPAAKVDAEKEKLAKYKEMKDKVETQLEQLKR